MFSTGGSEADWNEVDGGVGEGGLRGVVETPGLCSRKEVKTFVWGEEGECRWSRSGVLQRLKC